MRAIFIIFILGFFLYLGAIDTSKKYPPSEMIMMDFSDDDTSIESVKDIEISQFDQNETIDIVISSKEESSFTTFVDSDNLKVALLVPKRVIGSFANSVADSIISYLIYRDVRFQFEVFDSGDESEESIALKLAEIKSKGYHFVIAPLTQKGAEVINSFSLDMLVFIPTINRVDIFEPNLNILFGGIDYQRQIEILLSYANDKIAVFGDGSQLSSKLLNYIKEDRYESIIYENSIKSIKSGVSSLLKGNKKLKKSTIFLNAPVVKSSLLAAQLRQYNIKPHLILSTQVNYNPLLLKLTQPKDREFFYIANSIFRYDPILKDIGLNLGNNPEYNWINYSTSIGLDNILRDDGDRTIFDEMIYDNQIEYKVQIYKATDSGFKVIRGSEY